MATYKALMSAARAAHEKGDAYAAKRFLTLAKEAQAPKMGAFEAGINGLAQGITLGGADEGKAAIKAGFDWLKGNGFDYDRRLGETRADLSDAREAHPYLETGGEVLGSMALPGGAATKGGTLAARAVRTGLAGAAGGTVYGFNSGEGGAENRARSATVSGAAGGTVGALVPALGTLAGKIATNRATDKAIDTAAVQGTGALRADHAAMRAAASARGVSVKDTSFNPMVDDVRQMIGKFGTNSKITPKAIAAFREMEKIAKPAKNGLRTIVDWDAIETLRQTAANAARSADPKSPDRVLAGKITGKIDEFVNNLVDGDLASGSANGLGADIKQVRSIWSRVRNSERIQGAIEAAQDAEGGVGRGLRTQFRAMKKDARFFNALSPAEKQMITHVIRGTTVGKILRVVAGARGVIGGAAGGMVGAVLGGGAGAATGAVAAPAIGKAADALVNKSASKAAQRALGVASAGGIPRVAPKSYPELENVFRQYAPRAASAGSASIWNQ